jgi:ankyrin repeat protein
LLIQHEAIYGHKNITALHLIQSISDEDVEAVLNLLEIGFDPNVGDYDNRTPLHIAVAVGNLEPEGSAKLVGGKYSQFQDIHVMIFVG